MQPIEYEPTIVDKLLDFYKEIFGDTFRTYFFGDPIIFGKSRLPALIVSEKSNTSDVDSTAYDETVHQIQIKVVFSKLTELGKPQDEVGLQRKIYNIIEGKEKGSTEYSVQSVKGAIRKNFTVDGLTFQHVDEARYDTVVRPDDRITEEGLINVTLRTLELVPVRT